MKFVKGMDLSTLRETREKAFSTGSRPYMESDQGFQTTGVTFRYHIE